MKCKLMNIAIIHEVSYLNKPVYEYQDFAERLSAIGNVVSVYEYDEHNYSLYQERKVTRTGIGNIKLITLPNLPLPVLGKIIARLFFRFIFKKSLIKRRYDIVLVYSVFINGVTAISLCKKFNIPVLYRALDAYHKLRKNSIESQILLHGEKYIYNTATKIVVTNSRMQQYVHSIAGNRNPVSCAILDHGVDCDHFKPHTPNQSLINKLNIPSGSIVAIFLGTTYKFSNLDILIAKLRNLRKLHPTFVLLIVGSGVLDKKIAESIVKNGSESYVFVTGIINYKDLPQYLSIASIGLCPFSINDITRDIVPIKILQYMASGIPVISTPMADVVNNFPTKISGVFYSKSDNIEEYINCINNVLSNTNLLNEGARARDFVLKHYSIKSCVKKLQIIIDSQCKKI